MFPIDVLLRGFGRMQDIPPGHRYLVGVLNEPWINVMKCQVRMHVVKEWTRSDPDTEGVCFNGDKTEWLPWSDVDVLRGLEMDDDQVCVAIRFSDGLYYKVFERRELQRHNP